MDDTLVNTSEFHKSAVEFLLRYFEKKSEIIIPIEDRIECYNEIYPENKSNVEMFKVWVHKMYEKFPEKFEGGEKASEIGNDMMKEHRDYMKDNFHNYMPDKTLEVLLSIKRKGFGLGIISQGSVEFQKMKFGCLNVSEMFEKELLFYTENKSVDFYENCRDVVLNENPETKLYMVGDREDNDVIMPKKAGFITYRVLGDSKYAKIDGNEADKKFGNMKDLLVWFENKK